jgi:hypothetical protein
MMPPPIDTLQSSYIKELSVHLLKKVGSIMCISKSHNLTDNATNPGLLSSAEGGRASQFGP